LLIDPYTVTLEIESANTRLKKCYIVTRNIPIILLAGGASSRMLGRDKLLEDINGISLIRDRVLTCLQAAKSDVIVVIPPNSPDRREQISDLSVTILENKGSKLGLSHSISVGISALNEDQVMILLADLPEITSQDLTKVLKVASSKPNLIIRGASSSGKAGHPVIFKKELFELLIQLSGDNGAKELLREKEKDTFLVKLPNYHALSDLDTPEEWDLWRSARKKVIESKTAN
jgi:molybdenum cofactor cytidylyltransferase